LCFSNFKALTQRSFEKGAIKIIMNTRTKTKYVGVFYREAQRSGKPGLEKVFYIVFKKDGKVYEEKVGRQYANDMTPSRAAGIRSERIEGRRPSRKEMRKFKKAEKLKWTINRLWDEYKKTNPSIKGSDQDESRFKKYIEPFFGDKEPSEILPLDVDRLRINLLKKFAPGTVKNVLELLRRILNFGTKKYLVSPLRLKITLPKVNNQKTEDLSLDQLHRLLKALKEDHDIQAVNVMKLALFSGMRKGELFKLKWKDIDFDRGFISIKGPKGGIDQTIPMNEEVKKILTEHPKTEGSEFVFPGRGGRQRKDMKKALARIKKRAGLPEDFRPLHGLRHVFASMLASSGKVDMYTLQKLLTHKSPQMTQRYAHLRDETLKRATEVMGETIAELAK